MKPDFNNLKPKDYPEPTESCKELASKTYDYIFDTYSLIPALVLRSIEEGIFFEYRDKRNTINLIIEIYNTEEIACCVCTTDDKIMKSWIIEDFNFGEPLKLWNQHLRTFANA
jgi:hypothetical protein